MRTTLQEHTDGEPDNERQKAFEWGDDGECGPPATNVKSEHHCAN